MDKQDLIRLGMMVQELNQLRDKYGWWLQGVEVYSPHTSEPIVRITTGGDNYCVEILGK